MFVARSKPPFADSRLFVDSTESWDHSQMFIFFFRVTQRPKPSGIDLGLFRAKMVLVQEDTKVKNRQLGLGFSFTQNRKCKTNCGTLWCSVCRLDFA